MLNVHFICHPVFFFLFVGMKQPFQNANVFFCVVKTPFLFAFSIMYIYNHVVCDTHAYCQPVRQSSWQAIVCVFISTAIAFSEKSYLVANYCRRRSYVHVSRNVSGTRVRGWRISHTDNGITVVVYSIMPAFWTTIPLAIGATFKWKSPEKPPAINIGQKRNTTVNNNYLNNSMATWMVCLVAITAYSPLLYTTKWTGGFGCRFRAFRVTVESTDTIVLGLPAN